MRMAPVPFWALAVLATYASTSAKAARVASHLFAPAELHALLQVSKDSPCSDTKDVSRDTCLSKTEAQCMWLNMESMNLCLPCDWDGVPIPCAPIGSLFAMKKVKHCEMKCAHQHVLTKASACTDVGGSITTDDCFSKGLSALTKCMWTTYTQADGGHKNICGPCKVEGIGVIPPYAQGNEGPEGPGSTVDGAVSMCAASETAYGIPCDDAIQSPGLTNCHPTAPPPPPPLAPVPLDVLRVATNKDAPNYFAVPVPPPYGPMQYTEASAVGMHASGWGPQNALPPDAPVVIYGVPPFEGPTLPPTLKVMYGPPPPGIPGVPPPGYGMGTAPPPEMVKAAKKESLLFLSSKHATKPR
jgi:hypothetical protein